MLHLQHRSNEAATYDVQVTSASGCRWTAPQVTATVHVLPTAILSATPTNCSAATGRHRPNSNRWAGPPHTNGVMEQAPRT